MRHYTYWIHVGISLLLVMALSACTRSASNVITTMTPLPSAPPPTPTEILPTQITDPLVTVAASETASATEPTKRPTATKAQSTGSVTATLASTAAVCEGAPPTRLNTGLFAYVNPEPPLPNNLRSAAGENNEIMGYIEPGQAMKILEGPECADGWLWWKVQPLETDLTGWTAEGDAQNYWLVPCTSQEQCKP